MRINAIFSPGKRQKRNNATKVDAATHQNTVGRGKFTCSALRLCSAKNSHLTELGKKRISGWCLFSAFEGSMPQKLIEALFVGGWAIQQLGLFWLAPIVGGFHWKSLDDKI